MGMSGFQVFSINLQNEFDYKLTLFGRDVHGSLIRLNVTGFNHYFYIGTFQSLSILSGSDIFARLKSKYPTIWNRYVYRVKAVSSECDFKRCLRSSRNFRLQSVYGYKLPDDMERYFNVYKIYVTRQCVISKLEHIIHAEFNRNCTEKRVHIFETRVDWITRFMADVKLEGSNWIEYNRNRLSVPVTNVRQMSDNTLTIAPYTICSFDIECVSFDGTFPKPERDSIVQMAMVFAKQDTDSGNLIIDARITLSLGNCDRPISELYDAQVYEYTNEMELLIKFAEIVSNADPDIIMGYNIMQFDLPYFYNRAAVLGVCDRVSSLMSRTTVAASIRNFTKHGPYGAQLTYACAIPGRVVFDMYTFVRNEFKFSSYKLDDVAENLLGDRKIDVHHSEIGKMSQSATGRRRLAEYCIKDAELPIRLAEHTKAVLTCIEMSRAIKVSIESVLYQQPQYKLYSAILHETIARNMLMPSSKTVLDVMGINVMQTYKGAIVQEPKFGYYNKPVYVFDFASLYPSIMLLGNMCYSTHVPIEYVRAHADSFELETPGIARDPTKITLNRTGIDKNTFTYFVKQDCCEGVLPHLLSKLLRMRRQTRAAISLETSAFAKSVLDRRQNALKVCANAIYGFTGVRAERSWMPCTEIAMSVTATGRDIITKTVEYVTGHYDCSVIYGDTDSVMCLFNELSDGIDSKILMDFGKMVEKNINSIFDEPIRIEFECIYLKFLLVMKKRYVGLKLTNSDVNAIIAKGIETRRRDNFPLLRDTLEEMIEMFLRRDLGTGVVIDYVKNILDTISSGERSIDDYIITKEIKSLNLQPQVVTARKMEAREPGYGPKIGERVQYVITECKQGKTKNGISERADDPKYVLHNKIPLCKTYYSEKIKRTIARTFFTIFSEEEFNKIGVDKKKIKI